MEYPKSDKLMKAAQSTVAHVVETCRLHCMRALSWARTHRPQAAGIIAATVIVLLVIIFAASLSGSIHRLTSTGTQLASEYQTFKEHVLSGDGTGASEDADTICTLAAQLDRETNSWVWGIASALPSAGHDAALVHELTGINMRLANEVTKPFAQAYAQFAQTGILNSDGTVNALALAAHPGAVGELLTRLQELAPVISECNQQVQQLDAANSADLQQVIDSASETLAYLDTSFTALGTALSTTSTIGDTITSLLP